MTDSLSARSYRQSMRQAGEFYGPDDLEPVGDRTDDEVYRNDDASTAFPECPECGARPGQTHDPECGPEHLNIADCECYLECDEDPRTGCSLSGTWHVHAGEPCPVHPDAPGDR